MMMVELTKVMVDEFFSCQKSPGFLVHQHSLEIWRDESNTPREEDICVYNVNIEIKTGNYGYLYSVI
jgi:hypothetical protein